FDLLTAADNKNLPYTDASRTVAVASTSKTPTGAMVYDSTVSYPEQQDLVSRIDVSCRELFSFDALAAADALFGTTAPANFLLVGAAYQLGALPVPSAEIEEAIRVNGVAVEANLAAFRWGRAAVANPDAFDAAVAASTPVPARTIPTLPTKLLQNLTISGPLREQVARRAAELTAYQNCATAADYLAVVEEVWNAERLLGDRTEFSTAVVDELFKLTAYKDEYEVARLLTDPAFTAAVAAQFAGAANMTYRLHPPALQSLGRKKKIGFGPRTHIALRLLAKAKPLRGTIFDPFGYTAMRRSERVLVEHYRTMVLDAAASLTTNTYDTATALAQAADLVRGYESVKLANIERYCQRLRELSYQPPRLRL
ncbi:DUF6537 domain-containing protein, partial [Nocardia sp. NPDC004711]